MKKIKIVLLGVILAVGVLGSYNLTQAANKCCVKGNICKVIPANYPVSNYAVFCDDSVGTGHSITDCTADLCLSEVAGIQTSCCVLSKSNKDPKFGKPENCKQVNTEDAKTSCPGKLYVGSCSSAKPIECGGTTDATNTADKTDANPSATGTSDPITFSNPLAINSVSDLLASILSKLRGVIVIIAVIFIVIGGIMYMTSAGNEKMVTRAKQTWTGAVVGLAIALAAPAFLNEILDILKAGPDVSGTGSDITIKQIAINVLNFLLSIFGVLAIISLIVGGGMYLTAYGDEKKIDSGKKIITYAIIGIVVALSALVVTRQIANLIGVMAK